MDIPLDEFRKEYGDRSVSHGTMREEDLIPTFSDVLYQLQRSSAEYLRSQYDMAYSLLDLMGSKYAEATNKGLQEIGELTVALFEALERVAPEGFTFGAHEGDGSDYGFWSVEAEESE